VGGWADAAAVGAARIVEMRIPAQYLLLLSLLPASIAGAGGNVCPATENVVVGSVIGPGGRPLADAKVYGLLDRVSEKQTMKQGIRARSTRTDASGRFELPIQCGEVSGQPNPCASNPKHLTLIVGDLGSRMTLRQFKLKSVGMQRVGEGCVIEAPLVKLSGHL